VHPAYAENTGTVLLEAAIAGLPVLTTRACGYADYIRDADLGRVLDEPTAESLVAAARELLSIDRPAWWEKAARFAEQADIYSLVDHAVDAIEGEPPGAPR
jgi:UDP-glucose:(heptosyl)LPS alpha-1,3-glucosyltransferase